MSTQTVAPFVNVDSALTTSDSAKHRDWIATARKIDNGPDMVLHLQRAAALTLDDSQREASTKAQESLRDTLHNLEVAQREHADFLATVVKQGLRVKVSQAEIARAVGVNRSTVSRIAGTFALVEMAKAKDITLTPAAAKALTMNRSAKALKADLAATAKGKTPEAWETTKARRTRPARPDDGTKASKATKDDSPEVVDAAAVVASLRKALALAKTCQTASADDVKTMRGVLGNITGAVDVLGRKANASK